MADLWWAEATRKRITFIDILQQNKLQTRSGYESMRWKFGEMIHTILLNNKPERKGWRPLHDQQDEMHEMKQI